MNKKLILLSGLDGTGELFESFMDALPTSIESQVIAYPNDKKLSYEVLIDFVLSRLPKHEPYVLLAESFSGYVAYDIALKNPKNLQAVIFVATFLENPRPYLSKLLPFVPMSFLLSFPMPRFVANHLLLKRKSRVFEKLLETLKSVPSEILHCRILEIVKLSKVTKVLEIKSLYIQATTDKLVPQSAYALFEKNLPHIKLVKVKGSHLILQERSFECAKIIEEFIKS